MQKFVVRIYGSLVAENIAIGCKLLHTRSISLTGKQALFRCSKLFIDIYGSRDVIVSNTYKGLLTVAY